MATKNSAWYAKQAEAALSQAYTGHEDNLPYWMGCAQVYATLALAEATKEAAA